MLRKSSAGLRASPVQPAQEEASNRFQAKKTLVSACDQFYIRADDAKNQ
jgi:hypothetical protein